MKSNNKLKNILNMFNNLIISILNLNIVELILTSLNFSWIKIQLLFLPNILILSYLILLSKYNLFLILNIIILLVILYYYIMVNYVYYKRYVWVYTIGNEILICYLIYILIIIMYNIINMIDIAFLINAFKFNMEKMLDIKELEVDTGLENSIIQMRRNILPVITKTANAEETFIKPIKIERFMDLSEERKKILNMMLNDFECNKFSMYYIGANKIHPSFISSKNHLVVSSNLNQNVQVAYFLTTAPKGILYNMPNVFIPKDIIVEQTKEIITVENSLIRNNTFKGDIKNQYITSLMTMKHPLHMNIKTLDEKDKLMMMNYFAKLIESDSNFEVKYINDVSYRKEVFIKIMSYYFQNKNVINFIDDKDNSEEIFHFRAQQEYEMKNKSKGKNDY
jgi:hypothetical protein